MAPKVRVNSELTIRVDLIDSRPRQSIANSHYQVLLGGREILEKARTTCKWAQTFGSWAVIVNTTRATKFDGS